MGGAYPGAPGGPPMGGMPGAPGAYPGAPPVIAGVAKAAGTFSKIKMIVSIIGVVLVLGVVGAVFIYSYTHPTIHMINTSGKEGISIYMDGEAIATKMKNAPTESWLASESKMVPSGKHKFEAKDAGGKVIDTITIEIESGSNGYLYAPAHDKDVCFYIQVDEYGRTYGAKPPRDQLLDPKRTFWEMKTSIDRWFQDNPNRVQLQKGRCSDL